jgi:hypothetical protein
MEEEHQLLELYSWIDSMPFIKPKKSISRDFADGVVVAEIVNHLAPRLVELHNYQPASNTQLKLYNWKTLNQKVFKKLGLKFSDDILEAVTTAQPGAIEDVLITLKTRLNTLNDPQDHQHLNNNITSAAAAFHLSSKRRKPSNAAAAESVAVRNSYAAALSSFMKEGEEDCNDDGGNLHTTARRENNGCQRRIGGGGAIFAYRSSYVVQGDGDEVEELREAVELLEVKSDKLEALVRLKDAKIAALMSRLEQVTALLDEQNNLA